jgi:heme/copper-type cytochrome/quinol oxidase subunit 2
MNDNRPKHPMPPPYVMNYSRIKAEEEERNKFFVIVVIGLIFIIVLAALIIKYIL